MIENVESCLEDLADLYIKYKGGLDASDIRSIIKKHCTTVFQETFLTEYLGTEKGKSHFRKVLIERSKGATGEYLKELKEKIEKHIELEKQYVHKPSGSVISAESWEKEKEGMIRRGETPPQVQYITGKVSNLREPVFEDIESCQQIPSRYRDLLPLLDTYPAGSFLIEESVSPGTAKIDAILQKLKDGVTSIQDSTLFREYLLTMSKFWNYSIGNLILIMLQKRDATRVAGFTTWKELGRFVKAGEKGIMILAPCLPPKGGYEYWERGNDKFSVRYQEGQWYTYDINEKRTRGGPFKSKVEAESELSDWGFYKVKEGPQGTYETPRYFKVVYVFDISQTTGKELPVIEVKSLTGEANPELWDKTIALLKRKNVNMSFEPRPFQDPGIKGQFMMPNDIWIRPEESPAQQLKTIIHETGHYYTESVFRISRADAETIAESVAFVVGAHFGFDSGTRSFPYVAVWSQDKKVLDKNLAAIKNISSSILTDMGVQNV
jgi:hypothetical protein